MVLDKFTYAGNPANLPDGDRLPPRRHRRRARTSTRSARSMRSSTSPPRRTSTARSSGPEDFVRTDVLGTLVLLQAAEEPSARFVQVSTDEVYGDVEAGWSSREDDPLAPVEPVQRGEGRRRPAGARGGADLRRQRVDHARLEHVRARTSIRRRCCRSSSTNALDGEPLPLYGDGRQVRDWLHVEDHCAAIELVLRAGEAGRGLQRRRERGARERRAHAADRRAPRRGPVARPPRRGPRGARPALLARHDEDPRHSAGSRGATGRRRARDDRLVPRQPRRGGSRSSAPAVSASTTTGSTPRRLAASHFSRPVACWRRRSISSRWPWIDSERSSSSSTPSQLPSWKRVNARL